MKHLSAYLHDKEELQVQLFTIIPKKEVKGMMPDALKVWFNSAIVDIHAL